MVLVLLLFAPLLPRDLEFLRGRGGDDGFAEDARLL